MLASAVLQTMALFNSIVTNVGYVKTIHVVIQSHGRLRNLFVMKNGRSNAKQARAVVPRKFRVDRNSGCHDGAADVCCGAASCNGCSKLVTPSPTPLPAFTKTGNKFQSHITCFMTILVSTLR